MSTGPQSPAREEILARVRRALADRPEPPDVPRGYRHEGEHPPGAPELIELLAHRLVD